MRKVTHPHIVALVDILESTNHIHLVMEFCQLGDLATFVKKRDKLAGHPVTADMLRRYPNPPGAGFNEVIVRHFAKQLASALEFLRSKNLVHRDLKPQNLLLNPPYTWIKQEAPENRPYAVSKTSLVPAAGLESLPFLKIADFGFARHLPTTTMAETLCGSPLYMAPEILRYEKYDAKADLWSVGTVLYELMIGKPPFRAANHVELLRRIERTMDKIRFPDEVDISDEMKFVIRGLLKKTPTERMSWETFFQTAVITHDIPKLDHSDLPKNNTSSDKSPRVQEPSLHSSSDNRPSAPRRASRQVSEDRSSPDQPKFSTPPESTSNFPRRPSMTSNRPVLPDRATAPSVVPGTRNDRLPQAALDRRKSTQQDALPGPSAPRQSGERERERPVSQKQADRANKEARERAAQDVAFERDYVMVEKRAVEVNAFADELANSPAVQGNTRTSPVAPATMTRRATTAAIPSTSNRQGQQTPANRNAQLALRPEVAHQRRTSYDRRYAASRTSAQSALAAALNMVNLRFVNNPFGPALGKQPSPPQQGYGPFPAFPSQPSQPLMLGDTNRDKPVDEDHRVLGRMEDSASRSDVVYGFAEVKYKQLAPIAPSNEGALRGREDPSEEDDGLTPDAIISIAEEALVLYLKALAILTNTINLAGSWWSHKMRARETGTIDGVVSGSPRSAPDAPSGSSGDKKNSGFVAVGARINSVVQWSRNRFNECLEKSEFVSRKMLEAQHKLAEKLSTVSSSPSKMDEAYKGSGATAEKLMYERALDMSRAAAVNELTSTDLSGCEVSYLTAARLLEAVLEQDSDEDGQRSSKEQKSLKREVGDGIDPGGGAEKGEDEEVSAEDKETVVKRKSSSTAEYIDIANAKPVIEQMQRRLLDLRKKLALQKANARSNSKDKGKQPAGQPHQRTPSGTSPSERSPRPEAPRMVKTSSSPGSAGRGISPRS